MKIKDQLEVFDSVFVQCEQSIAETLKEFKENSLKLLNEKRESYASAAHEDEDALANFKRNAARLGLTPFQIWAVYFNKHVDSINNAIAANPLAPVDKSEGMEMRYKDVVNYAILGVCLLREIEQQK